MNETAIGLLGLFLLLAVFVTGVELGVGMAVIGLLGYCYVVSVKAGFSMLAQDVYDTFSTYGFTVIPVFILMGQLAFNGGIAKRLYASAYRLVGHIPGGLAMATVFGAAAFGSVTGATTAAAATFSGVGIPEMDRYHYSRVLSTGVVASAGCLGCLIPPSVPLIVYGIITEQSIGKLFLASIIPGLLSALCFLLIIYGWARMKPSLAPRGERSSWKERVISLKGITGVLVIFIVVMGGLLQGFFTPTEAGSVGAFAVAVLAFMSRDMNFGGLSKSLREALRTAAMVLLLIAGSTVFGHFITVTKIPMIAADWITNLPLHPHLIIIIIGLVYLIGGSFIDDLAFMILATPIFYPVAAKLGYDLIWFGIFVQLTIMIGVIIPPVAINVFVVKNITKESFATIYRGVTPFLLGLVFVIFLLFLVPQLALFIPSFLSY
ncbi:MAG: C4-dicarboxylate ABC transporter permease [Deltaproteobacteria bacterium HGW-Deltaproteobacteria-15]|jgi:tripartite ATP-independent transporter DctM subunit|nr:MAG: C4-dicarboxylate ABC transporter permease [Deltaproteobacteria bacterium HGW-Deltaproteobacteria-15]